VSALVEIAGCDILKVFTLLRRDVYDVVIEEADTAGLKVMDLVPIMAGLEHALESLGILSPSPSFNCFGLA
jgi:hypothetical protein